MVVTNYLLTGMILQAATSHDFGGRLPSCKLISLLTMPWSARVVSWRRFGRYPLVVSFFFCSSHFLLVGSWLVCDEGPTKQTVIKSRFCWLPAWMHFWQSEFWFSHFMHLILAPKNRVESIIKEVFKGDLEQTIRKGTYSKPMYSVQPVCWTIKGGMRLIRLAMVRIIRS